MNDLTGKPRGSHRCEHEACGGYTHVLKVTRVGLIVERLRRCTTCKATVTTRETRHGKTRPAKSV